MSLSERVAVNTPLLVLSRLASAASGLGGVAVTTRYLGPERFGSLTAATLYISLAAVFTDIGLYTIAAREFSRNPPRERVVAANVFTMGLLLSLCVAALALGGAHIVYPGPDGRLIRLAITLLTVHLLVAAPIGVTNAYLIAHERAWWTLAAGTVGSVVSLGGLLAIAAANLGFEAIVLSYASVAVVNVSLLLWVAVRKLRLYFAFDRALWRQLVASALPQGGVLIVGVLYLRADGLLLSVLRPARDVALYGVAMKVVEVLLTLPPYLMLTLLPALSRLDRTSERLIGIMQKALNSMQVVVLPLLVIVIGFAPQVVAIVGGQAYGRSALALQVLMVGVAAAAISALFGNALTALRAQNRLLLWALCVLVGNLGLNLVFIPTLGFLGAATAFAITELAALALLTRIYAGVSTLPRVHGLRRPLMAALCMAGVPLTAHFLLSSDANPLATLILGGALSIALYVLALRALGAVPVEIQAAAASLRSRLVRG